MAGLKGFILVGFLVFWELLVLPVGILLLTSTWIPNIQPADGTSVVPTSQPLGGAIVWLWIFVNIVVAYVFNQSRKHGLKKRLNDHLSPTIGRTRNSYVTVSPGALVIPMGAATSSSVLLGRYAARERD